MKPNLFLLGALQSFMLLAAAEDLTLPNVGNFQNLEPLVTLNPADELNGLQWNRYVSGDYVILSIDDRQGRWLAKNIESISSSCAGRWGIGENVSIEKECRIFCVPSEHLLKKLFNLDAPKAQARRNEDGSLKINAIWINLSSSERDAISPYLTYILFQNNPDYPFWFVKGAELLSRPIIELRAFLKDGVTPNLSLSELLSLDYSSYLLLSKEQKDDVDKQCVALCLMLRKELGQTKLVGLLHEPKDSKDVFKPFNTIYGYSSLDDLVLKYKSYCEDLTKEIKLNRMPDSYLLIKEAN